MNGIMTATRKPANRRLLRFDDQGGFKTTSAGWLNAAEVRTLRLELAGARKRGAEATERVTLSVLEMVRRVHEGKLRLTNLKARTEFEQLVQAVDPWAGEDPDTVAEVERQMQEYENQLVYGGMAVVD